VNSLPKTVTRQRRGCDLNPGPTAPESSTLTTRLPSQPPVYHGVTLDRNFSCRGHLSRGAAGLGWERLIAGFAGTSSGAGASTPRTPTNRRPPTEPFVFYFSLMTDAYETTT